MKRFTNKVVMITGANSGLGRATALSFAKEGARVALIARRKEEGLSVLEEIKSAGGEAIFISADVSIEAEVIKAVEKIIEVYGGLNIAFNNAGVAEIPCSVTDLDEAEWDRVLNVNLKGIWLCMKHQIPRILESGQGAIVNMASIYGQVATGLGLPAYVASKHGVIGLTKAAALEQAKNLLRINAVAPGWVPTPGNEPGLSNPDIKAYAESIHPMNRLGTQQEIADTVLWLSSDQASFITGQTISIDGGYTAQ